jgi:hypothetical protein
MLDNLSINSYVTAFIVASIGLVYIFDRAYNKPAPHVSEHLDAPTGLSSSQDIPPPLDPVPTVATEQPCLDSPEQFSIVTPEKSEPPSNPVDNVETVSTTRYKRPASNYNHELWPSPRPVNFVKALVKGDHIQIQGRITHGKAIELLAKRADMSPDVFLNTDPITYTKIFMPSQYKAAMLLGHSIHRLEATIRRHQYIDSLRQQS